MRRGLRSWKYRIADAAVGVSREIADGMIGAGIPASRVSAIHSGIDPSRYRPHEARQDGGFLFQSIGAFTPQKGYSVLVRAMAELRKRSLPPWAVRIVGDGPLLDPIKEEARTLGVDALLALLAAGTAWTCCRTATLWWSRQWTVRGAAGPLRKAG